MASWERKRQPDDVPTPVAVAVSDFCRRAGAPASPRAVREALSALSDSEDFRIRLVTDGEPPVRPLGPFAVVDLARGTPADVAALRERSGYYALVEEMLSLDLRADSGAGEPAAAGRTSPAAPPAPAPAESAGAEPGTAAGASPERVDERPAHLDRASEARTRGTVAERIAPRRRGPQEAAKPRGRFTRVETQRAPLEALAAAPGRSELEGLLAQHGHRAAVLQALAHGYAGARGASPSMEELDALLAEHGLLAAAEARERELILSALAEHRGALGRVAWALGLRPPDLQALVSRLGLAPEVELARERYRREALASARWTVRLDLLGRTKYLADLGVEREFEERLRADLVRELEALGPGAGAPLLARRLAAPATLVERALDRLGLSAPDSSSPTLP